MKTNASTRRRFLRQTGLAVAAFEIVRPHILGLRGATPPSSKLNIAGIGVAGQGGSDLNQLASENIVALCDVDWKHAAGTFKTFPEAERYKDFRRMLEEQKDIDAVIVATPDHMHAFASMAAIQLGKHVYCEKPLTHSVWEARQIAKAAREKKVATQMGNQGQASEATRRLQELVAAQVVGPIHEAHIWTDRPSNGLYAEYWPQGVDRPADKPPVPDTMDWHLWLGPAPERAYHPAYAPFRWRGWWDFGTGALGDIGCHSFDPVFRALRLGHPRSVEASSTRVNEETYPLSSMVTYQFPARGTFPELKLVWYDGGLRASRSEWLPDGVQLNTTGSMLVGEQGVIINQRDGAGAGYEVYPEARQQAARDVAKNLPRSIGHYKEFVQACQGGPAAGSNFDWAGPLAEVVLLGNVALRMEMRREMTTKTLLWDPEGFRFTNSPAATAFLKRDYRAGWSL